MQKEITVVIVIIFLIITTHILTQDYTKKNIALINEKISNVQEVARGLEENENEEKQQELLQKVSKIREEWNQIYRNMSFYIEHDELEKVNTSLTLSEGYLSLQEYREGIPELENCKYILKHIQDKQSLKTINLF